MKGCSCCGNDDGVYPVCPDCLADPCKHGAEMREDVFLVAFGVTGAASRDAAQDALIAELRYCLILGPTTNRPSTYVEEWWVAENDRRDHSDNDSAEFVPFRPTQKDAR